LGLDEILILNGPVFGGYATAIALAKERQHAEEKKLQISS